MTPAGTSNELDVQNGWEENTQNTHAQFVPSNLRSSRVRTTELREELQKMPKPFTSNTGRRDALHKVVFTIKQELNNMVTRNVGLTCVRETSGYGRRAWRHDDVPGVQGCHDGG